MGFFSNLFNNLFNKNKQKKTPAHISERSKSMTIDIQDDCFVINGNRFEIPMHVDALSAILGKPRAVKFKTDPEMRAFLEELEDTPVTNRVNYAWDDLGLMCYTLNGKVINAFGIHLRKQNHNSPANPKTHFGGKITINGQHWLPIVMSGDDEDTSRHVILGALSLTASYSDYYQDDSTRDETSFTAFEIQLWKGD
ncbi:MAG: hypothetical protein K2N06_10495 [Oscillospiraceae bacterium]|nr:hypothetical protein [Oscillospiraceae bacterium]